MSRRVQLTLTMAAKTIERIERLRALTGQSRGRIVDEAVRLQLATIAETELRTLRDDDDG